jgi:hypothetical protein
MRRFFTAMFIGGLVALGYGGVTKITRADGPERPSTVTFAAARYYVWYQYPGGRWGSWGPYLNYYDATRAQQDLNRGGARTFISNRPT